MKSPSTGSNGMLSAAAAPDRYRVGTLRYTKAGLWWVFVWLLWGDLVFQLMELVVPNVVPLRLKEELNTPNWLLPIIVSTLPQILNFGMNPIISSASDRHRGRMGRRIPFLLFSTPFITGALVAMAFQPEIGRWLHGVIGPMTGWSAAAVMIGSLSALMVSFTFCNMFLSTVFYYFFNDVVPGAFMARFFGCFRAIANIAGMLFNWFIFEHSLTQWRWIFLGAAALYGIGFPAMCLAIKEGKYPPPPPMGKGFFRKIGTYARECLSHRLYVLMFIHNMVWRAASAVGVFTVFLYLSLGLTKSQIGKVTAAFALAHVVIQPLAGILADRIHPMRLLVWIKIGLIAITPLNFVWLFGKWDPMTAFYMLIGLNIIHLPLGTLYDTVLQPMQMRVWPKSRYGQFCSFQAITGALTGIITSASVGLVFIGPMQSLFPDAVYGKDYCLRMMYAWQIPFYVGALVLLLMMYGEWKRLGGDKNYKVPGFEAEEAEQAEHDTAANRAEDAEEAAAAERAVEAERAAEPEGPAEGGPEK